MPGHLGLDWENTTTHPHATSHTDQVADAAANLLFALGAEELESCNGGSTSSKARTGHN